MPSNPETMAGLLTHLLPVSTQVKHIVKLFAQNCFKSLFFREAKLILGLFSLSELTEEDMPVIEL